MLSGFFPDALPGVLRLNPLQTLQQQPVCVGHPFQQQHPTTMGHASFASDGRKMGIPTHSIASPWCLDPSSEEKEAFSSQLPWAILT